MIMLKKRSLFALALMAVIMLGVFLFVVTTCHSYSIYLPEAVGEHYTTVKVRYSEENIVSNSELIYEDGYYKITFYAMNQGTVTAEIELYDDGNKDGGTCGFSPNFKVGIFNIIMRESSGNIPNISGYTVFYVAAALFFCIMAVYMIIRFRKNLKQDMYSYGTVFNCSLMILFVGLGVIFTSLSAHLLLNYRDYQSDSIRELTMLIMFAFVIVSVPFVLLYSLSMTISNISLIRHEGFRVANALGIAVSVVMTVGVLTCIVLPLFFYVYIPREIFSVLYSVICTLYMFLELFLLGTKICGLIAAKHKPAFDKDYIIILGCGIKKDGTLLPLLKGRVDKAVEFYNNQLKATGKKAVFVPSGGQGSDEIISEGEAMKRYLLQQGIPEEQIMPETESTNTLENMKFSKKLIGSDNAQVAFSTTNYHVFRSGIFAGQAGLKADGMGSKTKWYFWPNAFIREFVGLLVSRKKKIIILAVLAVVISVCSALFTL